MGVRPVHCGVRAQRRQPRHCNSIDFLKSVASDFGRSFLSLLTSASTRQQHAVTLPRFLCVTLFMDVASWITPLTPGLPVAVLQNQYCAQGSEGRQGPKGHQHLLVYCFDETSSAAAEARDKSTWRWEASKARAGHTVHRNSSYKRLQVYHRRFSPLTSKSEPEIMLKA